MSLLGTQTAVWRGKFCYFWLLAERLPSVGRSVRSRDGEKTCLCLFVVSLCGVIAICVAGRDFFYREFRVAIKGVETVEKCGEVLVVLGELEAGGGGVLKLIWSWMPQRHGRCELATHPDRNLSRLHRCFVFQINWPLKIALRPSQHYWCTFSSPQLKVCTPHAALSPSFPMTSHSPCYREQTGPSHQGIAGLVGQKNNQTQEELYNSSVWVWWLSLIAVKGWGCLFCNVYFF